MKLNDVLKTWENVSQESNILIQVYNSRYQRVHSYKLNVWHDLLKRDARYKYLLDYEVMYFRKSCHGIRFDLRGDNHYENII